MLESDAAEHATTRSAGRAINQGKGRVFPCEGCGADLEFHIGTQRLKCPYCGYEKDIHLDPGLHVVEQDFEVTLERLRELREKQTDPLETDARRQVRCESCGGAIVFLGTLTSSECPYCGSPVQFDESHAFADRLPVDGVLPFMIERQRAGQNLAAWVRSRWFAPNEFLDHGVTGKFNGVYLPYWTFDTLTGTHYEGQRGEHYWVTVGVGKNKRRQRRTRWYPASGAFQRFFDDVLVVASRGLPEKFLLALEPWPLARLSPFNHEMLAGCLARTYEVELPAGFHRARQLIDAAIEREVRERIGGDEQRVHAIRTRYEAITFKQLLLPTWLLTYRYKDKPYRVMVNATTGEVQGERPYSWVKITLAALAAAIVVAAALLLMR